MNLTKWQYRQSSEYGLQSGKTSTKRSPENMTPHFVNYSGHIDTFIVPGSTGSNLCKVVVVLGGQRLKLSPHLKQRRHLDEKEKPQVMTSRFKSKLKCKQLRA
jgi:hypothetical protein